MFDNFSVLETFELLAGVLGLFAVIGVYRRAKRGYVKAPYEAHSRPAADAWRWRAPDDTKVLHQRSAEDHHGLRVEDGPEGSKLHIPLRMLPFEKGAVVFGYLGLAGCAWMLAVMLIDGRPLFMYSIMALFVALPWAMLYLGSRVVSIELSPDRVVFTLNYGLRFYQKKVFLRRTKKLSFKGHSESVLEMTIDHDQPDFKLFVISRGWIFKKKKRFILSVNQSQGEWLVEGLNFWIENPPEDIKSAL